MKTTPYFIEKVPESPARNNLEKTINANILIVGGGMVSFSTAYALSTVIDPIDITLVDSGRVGFSTTGRSAGLLVDSVEEDYCDTNPEDYNEICRGIQGIADAIENERLDCSKNCQVYTWHQTKRSNRNRSGASLKREDMPVLKLNC